MRRKVSEEAFEDGPQHHVTNPKIKAAPKAPPKSSKEPQTVRMQVSFVIPNGLSRTDAVRFVFRAVRDAAEAAELQSLEELQVVAFSKGFKT